MLDTDTTMPPGTCWQNAQDGGWLVMGLHGTLLVFEAQDASRANEAASALADLYWEATTDARLDAEEV